MKLIATIETLEARLLKAEDAYQHYVKEHPGTKKTPSDPAFKKHKPSGETIGTTEKGKPVADTFSHPAHKKFDSEDHDDAAHLQYELASKHERQIPKAKPKDRAALKGKAEHHREQGSKHRYEAIRTMPARPRRKEIEDL